MKSIKKAAAGSVARTAAFLLAGALVSTGTLACLDTYAWFRSRTAGELMVSAAGEEDIIKEVRVNYNNEAGKTDPVSFTITRADGLVIDPLRLHFSIEGDIAEYLLHLNPVELFALAGGKTVELKPKLDLEELLRLLLNGTPERLTGIIRIKYMNEFINKGIEITFTRDYLLLECLTPVLGEDWSRDASVWDTLLRLMRYLAQARPDERGIIPVAAAKSAEPGEEGKKETYPLPSGLSLTAEEAKTLEAIIPGLISYLEEVREEGKSLADQLYLKDAELEELKARLGAVEDENACLSGEILRLNAFLEGLRKRLEEEQPDDRGGEPPEIQPDGEAGEPPAEEGAVPGTGDAAELPQGEGPTGTEVPTRNEDKTGRQGEAADEQPDPTEERGEGNPEEAAVNTPEDENASLQAE